MHRRHLLATGLALPTAAACGPVADAIEARSTRGLDAGLIAETVSLAERLPKLRAMTVARDGQTLFERVFAGPSLDTPVNVKSASKSIMAALAGIAIGQGLFGGGGPADCELSPGSFPAEP